MLDQHARRVDARSSFQPNRLDASATDELTLSDVWWAVRQNLLRIALTVAITTGLAVAAVFLSSPIYQAQVLLAPAEQDLTATAGLANQLGGLSILTGRSSSGMVDPTNEAIAVLRSRAFSESFIVDQDLTSVLVPDPPPDIKIGGREHIYEAFKVFDQMRQVARDPETGLVRLTISWGAPEQAVDWVNKLVSSLNERNLELALLRADQHLSYLRGELEETSSLQIRTSLVTLVEEQLKAKMLARSRAEYSFRVVDPAALPLEQSWPKPVLFVAVGLAMGLALGVLIAFVSSARGPRSSGAQTHGEG